ncbi:hypothetical protein GBL_1541 [Geobacillus kaustophilus GBlys]|uniref:Uncharacterized protein n=1 Tax=Geobacillus kaustophilus GBlys TaxID=1337888 RepID=U2Y2J4_GEOKU|nr:hypothetical protein GBL_1541 [Geobacillus kaustophilus GBlys]
MVNGGNVRHLSDQKSPSCSSCSIHFPLAPLKRNRHPRQKTITSPQTGSVA